MPTICRNLYLRMFGMELDQARHAYDLPQPLFAHVRDGANSRSRSRERYLPFVRPAAASHGFAFPPEELLREVMRGSRARATPRVRTRLMTRANLTRELEEMLVARRGDPTRST
jgi:hypothetical protein